MLQLAIKESNDRINLDQSRITIGREGANTVVLSAGDVSGYHAEIHCESDGAYLVDLGSTNGTSVNGRRINRRQKLAAWDRVAFASVGSGDCRHRRPPPHPGAWPRGTGAGARRGRRLASGRPAGIVRDFGPPCHRSRSRL